MKWGAVNPPSRKGGNDSSSSSSDEDDERRAIREAREKKEAKERRRKEKEEKKRREAAHAAGEQSNPIKPGGAPESTMARLRREAAEVRFLRGRRYKSSETSRTDFSFCFPSRPNRESWRRLRSTARSSKARVLSRRATFSGVLAGGAGRRMLLQQRPVATTLTGESSFCAP